MLSGADREDIPCAIPGSVAEAVCRAGAFADNANPAARVDEARYAWVGGEAWALRAELPLEGYLAERSFLEIEGLFGSGILYAGEEPVARFERAVGESLRADITSHIASEQEALAVTVRFTGDAQASARDGGESGAPLPGIRGGVWLHGVNRMLLTRLCVRPDRIHPALTSSCRALPYALGKYTFAYALSYGDTPLGVRLFEEEVGPEELVLEELSSEEPDAAERSFTERTFAHSLNLADLMDWTPGRDNTLYHVKLTILWHGVGCDIAHQRVGMIRVDSQRVWPKFPPSLWAINRQPRMLRGTVWTAPGWYPCRADWTRAQLRALLEARIDCLYVPAPQEDAFYDLCDRMGMMVWQGLPGEAEQAKAVALRLMHRPCVAQWGMPAEAAGTEEHSPGGQADREAAVAGMLAALGDDRPFAGATPGGPTPFPDWKDLGKRQCYNVAGPLQYLGPEMMPRYANDDDALLRVTGFAALCAPEKLRGDSGEPLPWPRGGAQWQASGGPLTYLEQPEAAQWFGPGATDTLERASLLGRYLQAEALRYLAERFRQRGAVGFFAGSAGQASEILASDAILERDGAPRPAYRALRDAYEPIHPCLTIDRAAHWVGTPLDVGVQLLVAPEAADPSSPRTVTAALYGPAGRSLAEDIWKVPCRTGLVGRLRAELPDEPCALLLRLEVYRDGEPQARSDTVVCVGVRALQEALSGAPETTLALDEDALTNTGGHLALGVSCGDWARPGLPGWGAMLPGERLPVHPGAAVEALNARVIRAERS